MQTLDTAVETLLLVWSIRLAIACYLGCIAIDLRNIRVRQAKSSIAFARWLWTGGFALYAAHIAFAFAFVHGWSHDQALAHTSEQTARVVGFNWGGGLYFNYAFTAFWMFDSAVWWTRGLERHSLSRGYFVTLHTVFAFMLFNATVVFGPPWYKPVAAMVGLTLVALVLWPASKKVTPA